MKFSIPDKLLMGVSTASLQIEGGDSDNNWNDWYRKGFIKDGTNPATGNDHWVKWQEDTELMAQMGLQIYRFGIEWARLMPCSSSSRSNFSAKARAEYCFPPR